MLICGNRERSLRSLVMPESPSTILIADDDPYVRDDLADLLSGEEKYRLLFAATGKETWKQAEAEDPDLVLLDLRFPDVQDLSLLKKIKTELPQTEIIIVSSQASSVPQIVEAIKWGAYDFVPKPFVREELLNRVEKALSLRRLRRSQDALLRELQKRNGLSCLIGSSSSMEYVRTTIRKLADLEGCVLIQGDTGTGKELAARALHYISRRRAHPFVVINCAAIPESLIESVFFGHRKGAFTSATEHAKGKFEAAEEGTIFLDEIGDMPIAQQTSLLRVLEYRKFTPVGEHRERECRARFVLATNRDLREEVKRGRFREDLYYRIKVATLEMPPLVARPEDLLDLVNYYVQVLTAEMGRLPPLVHADVLKVFRKYDWPGNVRELKNILEGALMLLDPRQEEISLCDLPPEILATNPDPESAHSLLPPEEQRERRAIIRAIRQSGGNQTQAARLLGCHRNTIRSRIRYLGITHLFHDAAEDSSLDQQP